MLCSSRVSDITVAPMLAGPNPLHPDRMAAAERLDEVAAILAAGLVRLLAPKSSELSADPGESSLHFSPDQSGHALRKAQEEPVDRHRPGPRRGPEDDADARPQGAVA